MNNSIRVSLEYSFKGETHTPSAVIDLDSIADSEGAPDWHALLATCNKIDTYSYTYEVMRATEPQFSDATGLASASLAHGRFDFDGFLRMRERARTLEQLQQIAKATLSIESLDAEPKVRAALLQAFELGTRTGSR